MLLRLLGAPALNHADGTLVFAPERRFQLLALLAHRGEWMSRERLAALFWPDHSAEAARRNLRKVLHRLHELGTEIFAATPVQEQGGAMRWPVATDLAEFEQAVDRGDRTRALAVWQGEPWQGIDGSGGVPLLEWLGIERQRLTSRWRDTLLAEARASTEPLTVLRHAELAMAQNPLDEEALRVAIEAWLRIDRRVDATRAYMAFSRRLAESLALEPSARTRELLQESRRSAAGAVSEAPDTAAAALPFVVDSGFIGRDAEQRELSALLAQPDCRWVTVVGPGGIGKSRLLMRAIDRFGDTARWIPLEGASSSAGLANRIGSALGLPVAGEEAEAYAQLAAGIGKTERLLALDNLEHLLPAVPRLAMLLQGCPGLRIVATSRERAGVEGEWLVPLAGLPFPELEDSDRAEAFDAVRLFVVRARQVDPRFELGPQRDGVVELCRWVEGMPLAIELAAVWIRHFRADEIAREVRSGGEMLREPAGTQFAPRQRSITATFEHSWQLLVPAERKVLAALSVFRGGFTRAAATAVAGASLALLTALVEKSLVRREEGAGAADPSATRFGLHPLIQQFAADKLRTDPGGLVAAEQFHAEYVRHYLLAMPGAEQQARRSAFRIAAQADLDNIAAAWRWAAGRGRTDLLLDMATPLRIVFFSSSRRGEALAMLDSVYAQVALAQPRGLALLDLSRGILQYGLGRFVEATQMLRQAVRGLRRGSDRRDHRTGLIWLGQAQMFLGRLDAARHCLEQALASARADRDERAIGDCIGNLGGIDYTLGRFESAVAWMQESLDLRTAAGGELALGLNNLGLAQLFAGRADSAIETLQRGLVASAREPDQDAAATAASPACSSTAASCTRSTSRASARCGAAAGGGTPPATSAPKAGRWSSTSTGLVQQQRAASGRSTYKSKANGESTFVGQGCVAVHGRLRASDESSMTSYYSGC